MREELSFHTEAEFLIKLKDCVAHGASYHNMTLIMPYHVHGVEEIVAMPPSPLKFFTLCGAIIGFVTGMTLTIYTVMHWPLITSGKPLVSLPPYLIIAFELTILIGGLMSFAGFLLLARLPKPKDMLPAKEYGNQFVILLENEA